QGVCCVPTFVDTTWWGGDCNRLRAGVSCALGHRLRVDVAGRIGIRPDDDVTPAQRRPVGLVGAFVAVRAGDHHKVRQQAPSCVGGLLSLADDHWREGPNSKFLQAVEWPWCWPALPAPFQATADGIAPQR